jgi:5-methylthioadenosine/S-adenosylhomocysteine deaminase
MALACQRALDNAQHRAANGSIPETTTVNARQALEWITLSGARALGLADRTGSITVGKQADLLLVRCDSLGMSPLHDPAAALVLQSEPARIDSVMVAGQFVKRHGRLYRDDLPALLDRLRQSGSRILSEIGVPSVQSKTSFRPEAMPMI